MLIQILHIQQHGIARPPCFVSATSVLLLCYFFCFWYFVVAMYWYLAELVQASLISCGCRDDDSNPGPLPLGYYLSSLLAGIVGCLLMEPPALVLVFIYHASFPRNYNWMESHRSLFPLPCLFRVRQATALQMIGVQNIQIIMFEKFFHSSITFFIGSIWLNFVTAKHSILFSFLFIQNSPMSASVCRIDIWSQNCCTFI